MRNLIKESIKILVIALFIGLMELLNDGLIEGNIYTVIAGVKLSNLISAVLIVLLVLFLIRFGVTIGKLIRPINEFLSRLSKIGVWFIAFLLIIFNDNFHTSMSQLMNGFLSSLGIYATRSAIENYIVAFEIILIAIPLISFFVYFFQNLDSYLDLFFKRASKDVVKDNEDGDRSAEPEKKESVEG